MELEIWFDRYQYKIDYDIGGDGEEIKTGLSNLNQALSKLPA
jgi:hypothetical protein